MSQDKTIVPGAKKRKRNPENIARTAFDIARARLREKASEDKIRGSHNDDGISNGDDPEKSPGTAYSAQRDISNQSPRQISPASELGTIQQQSDFVDPDSPPLGSTEGDYEYQQNDSGSEELQLYSYKEELPGIVSVIKHHLPPTPSQPMIDMKLGPGHPEIILHDPCVVSVKSGVIRIHGAQLNANTDPLSVCAMRTHLGLLIETQGEAVVRLDYLDYQHDSNFQSLLDATSSYSTVKEVDALEPILRFPPLWSTIRNDYLTNKTQHGHANIIHICGGKSSAHRIFAKFMLNSLFNQTPLARSRFDLSRVYILDLDASAPEFTPQGQISLVRVTKPIVGSSFMNIAYQDKAFQIVRAHALPADGSHRYPQLFARMVDDLVKHVNQLSQGDGHNGQVKPALLVRHGIYQNPMHGDILTKLIHSMNSPSTVYVLSRTMTDSLSYLKQHLGASHDVIPVTMPKITAELRLEDTLLGASEEQDLQLMSYFHHEVVDPASPGVWNPLPVAYRSVCRLSWHPSSRDFHSILPLLPEAPAIYDNWLSSLIDGNVVSIAVIEDVTALHDRQPVPAQGDGIPWLQDVTPSLLGSQPLDPTKSRLIGVALVRAVNTEKQILELIIPAGVLKLVAPISVPAQHIVLMVGCFEPPAWAVAETVAWQQKHASVDSGQRRPAPWTSFPKITALENGEKRPLGMHPIKRAVR